MRGHRRLGQVMGPFPLGALTFTVYRLTCHQETSLKRSVSGFFNVIRRSKKTLLLRCSSCTCQTGGRVTPARTPTLPGSEGWQAASLLHVPACPASENCSCRVSSPPQPESQCQLSVPAAVCGHVLASGSATASKCQASLLH